MHTTTSVSLCTENRFTSLIKHDPTAAIGQLEPSLKLIWSDDVPDFGVLLRGQVFGHDLDEIRGRVQVLDPDWELLQVSFDVQHHRFAGAVLTFTVPAHLYQRAAYPQANMIRSWLDLFGMPARCIYQLRSMLA